MRAGVDASQLFLLPLLLLLRRRPPARPCSSSASAGPTARRTCCYFRLFLFLLFLGIGSEFQRRGDEAISAASAFFEGERFQLNPLRSRLNLHSRGTASSYSSTSSFLLLHSLSRTAVVPLEFRNISNVSDSVSVAAGKIFLRIFGSRYIVYMHFSSRNGPKTFPCDKGRGDGQEESLWGRFFNLCCTYLSSRLPPIQKSLPRDTPVSPILQIRSLKVGAGGGDENGRGTGIHVRTNERETKRRQRQFLDDEGGGGGEGNFFPCPFRSPPWPSREKKEKRIEEKEENSCLKSR